MEGALLGTAREILGINCGAGVSAAQFLRVLAKAIGNRVCSSSAGCPVNSSSGIDYAPKPLPFPSYR
jgi:hypothetical protein